MSDCSFALLQGFHINCKIGQNRLFKCWKVEIAYLVLKTATHKPPAVLVQATQLSGKAQFPFMVDPNTGRSMLESDNIISYLWSTYGDGDVRLGSSSNLSEAFVALQMALYIAMPVLGST